MKRFLPLALTVLATPAFCADWVITTAKHTDAVAAMPGMPGMAQPAKDWTSVTWIGKDHMRVEDGDKVTLVRPDLKKVFLLDVKAKTYSALDLPIDVKKYMPADVAPMVEMMMAQVKITVTPTTETKKVKDWTATKYTYEMSGMMAGASLKQDIWATKDLAVDAGVWHEMFGALQSMNPLAGPSMAAEMKKIEGVPVLTERTQSIGGTAVKSKDEVTSVEQKEPAEGLYDVPKDFTEKPYDPMEGMGGPRGGMGGGKPGGMGGAPKQKPPEKAGG